MKLRIIPTVLFNKNNCVKGKQFKSWRVCGSITQVIKLYSLREVDEIIFLDISANKSSINLRLIDDFADDCYMPITVGGGVKSLLDIENLLKIGADRVCINTSAFKNPAFIKEAVEHFGSQCIVISVDYKNINGIRKVFINSGRYNTNVDLKDYISQIDGLNPSEIVLTSIDHDGMLSGYDFETILSISNKINSKLIVSGGMSNALDIEKIVKKTNIQAFSMSSIFHFTQITPLELKKELQLKGLNVRI